MSTPIYELSEAELDALIERVRTAIEHQLALSAADLQRLLDALLMLTQLQGELSSRAVTVHKLRKLAGMVQSSEKLTQVLGAKQPQQRKRPASAGRQATAETAAMEDSSSTPEPVVHQQCIHQLTGWVKGDRCPECQQGSLYKYQPATLLRISGQTPLTATQHLMERLRCNACGAYFTAPLPDEVKQDGEPNQRYGYSARAIIGLHKHFAGIPFYRQQTLQQMLGLPVSASTAFDQSEHLANAVQPILTYLKQCSANAVHYHIDDTPNRILDQRSTMKPDRRSGKLKARRGIYTSGLIATLADLHDVILFQTNIGHAGEHLDELLAHRSDPSPPILMSDALRSNQPVHLASDRYHMTLCNAHARRQFVDLLEHYPDKIPWVLERYGEIWTQEAQCQAEGLTAAERLHVHQTHSLPVMEQLRQWGEQQLESGDVEANSNLGKAIRYLLNHYTGLTEFCRIEGAQLDNNLMESIIKWVIRGRKNALFFKTQAGAAIADTLVSIIATCYRAQVNPFDYLIAVQRHSALVKENPNHWLPWSYASQS
jgi:transposase